MKPIGPIMPGLIASNSNAAAVLLVAGQRIVRIERNLARQIGHAESGKAAFRLQSEAARDAIEWNRNAVARNDHLTEVDRRQWEVDVEPLIGRVEAALEAGDGAAVIETGATIAAALGQPLPWRNFAEFDHLMRTGTPAEGITTPQEVKLARELEVNRKALDQLGKVDESLAGEVDDPLALAFRVIYRDMGIEPLSLGSHVRVARKAIWHHALVVGSDQLIHYSGEGLRSRDAEICSTDWTGFRKQSNRFETVVPTSLVGSHIAPMRGSMVVFRAHQRLGENDYAAFCNNCEHFAFASQLGAGFSRQGRAPWRNKDLFDWADAAVEASADPGDMLDFELRSVTEPELMSGLEVDPILDLGRAFIDRMTGEPEVFIPMWDMRASDAVGPFGSLETPWTDARCSTWATGPRSKSIDLDLLIPFAALLWSPATKETFWLTEGGDILRPRFELYEALEARLEPNRVLLNKYFYPGLAGEGMQRAGSFLADKLGPMIEHFLGTDDGFQ